MKRASCSRSACDQREPAELIAIIWHLCGNLWVCLKIHQIKSTKLNTAAAEMWHRWFWLWAGSWCCVEWLRGKDCWRPGWHWNLPRSLPEAAASQQPHCLQCKHFSSEDKRLSPTILPEKPLQCVLFFLFKPSLFVSFFCSSFSLLLHYAPISSPLLLHIHAESLYLSTLCLWKHCTAFLNTFSMVSHRGCCLDVTRTNLPVFSYPWVRGKAHQSKHGNRCLTNGSLLKPVLS